MAERILVVDDTPQNVKLLDAVLTAHGYEVLVATTGQEALDALADQRVDLVLLDVYLPDIQGHEICQRLRANPATAFLPVVMITAAGTQERLPAIEAGADDFVTKPFDQAELLARVRSLLRVKRYHDTIETQAAELAEWNQSLERRVAEQVEELDRLGRLRRFLSPQVADLIVAAGDEGLLDTHRREIAVLFADLRGFTNFARTAEPEDVMVVLGDFHRAIGALVQELDATVGYFSGDGIMVFFNDPVPCDAPAARAVEFAVRLRGPVEELAVRWRAHGHELGLGVGVALGYATLGTIGFEGRYDYGAIGTVVNLASRLCDEAKPGEILVGPSVHATAERIAMEPAGPKTLKGFTSPVEAWRVTAGAPVQEPSPVTSRPGQEAVASAPEPPPTTPEAEGNAFALVGDQWRLSYDGTTVQLRDAKGIHYLARLLAEPGREFHVADLVGHGADKALVQALGNAGEMLDARAKASYKRRLQELEAERDEARAWQDDERAARADAEIDFITQELASAYGLGGRPRKDADAGERVRKAVTNRIRDSLTKIQQAHPVLGRHLANAVRTGTFCVYQPERSVAWSVRTGEDARA